MRKIALLLAVILLLGCLAGCHQQPAAGAALTHAQKSEIENAWKESHSGKFPGWYDWEDKTADGFVFLATDNGYHILLLNPKNTNNMEARRNIAGKIFRMPHSFSMYAYKNGEFTNLSAAYGSGYVSDEGIAAAFEVYKEFVCTAFPNLASAYGYK